MMECFHIIFRNLRLNNNYTQKEIAEKLGISKSAISMYENGSRIPDLETLKNIADLFSVNLDELSGREPIKRAAEIPYQDMEALIARNGKHLSTEEKMKLIRLLSDIE